MQCAILHSLGSHVRAQYIMAAQHVLVFPHTVSVFPESERHYPRYDGQVPRWSEAACGKVALVLDGLVAPGGGHILRHGGGCAGEVVAEEWYG